MTPLHPYIVLTRGMRLNPTDGHLVVHVDEWVAVSLGEKKDYIFAHEHPDYASAADERDQLNHQPGEFPACPDPEPEPKRSGITLARKQKAST